MYELGIATINIQLGWQPSAHQHASILALVFGLFVKHMDLRGSEGPSCSIGSTSGGGVGETRSQLMSAFESSLLPGLAYPLLEGCEASGPKLNRKTAAICLHCYLCFKRMTACQCK